MKIAICSAHISLQVGGAGRYMRSMFEGFGERDVRIDAYIPRYEIINSRIKKTEIERFNNIEFINLFNLPLSIVFCLADISYTYSLIRKIREKISSYDAVHFNQFQMPMMVDYFVKRHKNTIYTLHHPWTFDLKDNYDKFFWSNAIKFDKSNAQKIAKIITVSESSKRSIVENYKINPEKIFVVPNGVETKKFKPYHAVNKNEKQILFVGNTLNRRKGFDLLYNAFINIVQKEHPDAKLCVVGRKPVELKDNNKIEYYDFMNDEDLIHLYNSSMITAVPSRYEAFSYPCLESMSCGIPVVGTGRGGIPEVIIDGMTGLLSDASEKRIGENIVYLLDNSRIAEKMGKEGARRARENFSIETMIDKTLNVYSL